MISFFLNLYRFAKAKRKTTKAKAEKVSRPHCMVTFFKASVPTIQPGFRPMAIMIFVLGLVACQPQPSKQAVLGTHIRTQIDAIDGEVAVAFQNLSDPSDRLLIHSDESFHAASTMKVPVMIELFKQQREGLIDLSDSILLVNEFKSIVDGSPYEMSIDDDSDDVIYRDIGQKVALNDLLYAMITVSSNLATNVLIELVDTKKVTATMRDLGANNIEVLRGVEDIKAYEQGLSNATTARDLMVIMQAIAEYEAGSPADCREMVRVLKDQQFNEIIPFYLPDTVEVAHKTGSITGVHHDAGIVYLPDGRSYVLVLLSKDLENFEEGTEQLAGISRTVYEYMLEE